MKASSASKTKETIPEMHEMKPQRNREHQDYTILEITQYKLSPDVLTSEKIQ